MQTITTPNGKIVKIFAETIDEASLRQIEKLANCTDYEQSEIRIMPDCHAGAGCTIGTTMTITDRLTPNLVGVDIGCGMLVVELKNRQIDLRKLDSVIHEFIPCGMKNRRDPIAEFNFSEMRCPQFGVINAQRALGTLGGGNHFIELDYSEQTERYYLVIHSGSRNPGKKICEHYQRIAASQFDPRPTLFEQRKNELLEAARKAEAEHNKRLSKQLRCQIDEERKRIYSEPFDTSLASLSGQDIEDYLNDMRLMQQFASVNRQTMADIILAEMHLKATDQFETIHNYIDLENMILRKGAVSAQAGERLLIPINMRDGSLICLGKGNPDWNYSAPHGAGRILSRGEAFRTLSMSEYKEQMKGIYSTSVCPDTLDESPMAYKSANEILRTITPTAEVIDRIRPVYNFKAAER